MFRDKAEPLHPLVSLRDDGGAAKGDKTLVERGYSPLRGRDAQEDVRLSADPVVLSKQVQFAADLRPVEIKNRLSVSYLKAEGDRNDIRVFLAVKPHAQCRGTPDDVRDFVRSGHFPLLPQHVFLLPGQKSGQQSSAMPPRNRAFSPAGLCYTIRRRKFKAGVI